MAHTNPANIGFLTGIAAYDVAAEARKGSKGIYLTTQSGQKVVNFKMYVRDNFTSGPNNENASHQIELKYFVPKGADGFGILDYVGKGDKLQVDYAVRSNTYTDSNGNQHINELSLVIGNINLLTSKQESAERRARHASEDNQAAPAAQAQAPQQAAPAAQQNVAVPPQVAYANQQAQATQQPTAQQAPAAQAPQTPQAPTTVPSDSPF